MSFLGSREKGDSGCDKWSFSKCSESPELLEQNLVENARPFKLFVGNGDGACWRVEDGCWYPGCLS